MCTLIAGIGILGAGTLIVGANRDESPERPASGPTLLRERPRIVGGRDLVAGGTWLAVREARVVLALMNRRGDGPPASGATPRSRGLLCVDAAAAGPAVDAPATIDPGTGEPFAPRLIAAAALAARDRYAPFTLIGLEAGGPSWALILRGDAEAETRALPPGWHVVTHEDPDDRAEPRTAWILERLRGMEPRDVDEALDGVAALLREHGDPERGVPASCLHRERFPTVSSSLLALGVPAPRYLHAAGPPCTTPYEDRSALLNVSGS